MTHPRITAISIDIVAKLVGTECPIPQDMIKLVAKQLEVLSDFMERKGYVEGLQVAARLAIEAAEQIQTTEIP